MSTNPIKLTLGLGFAAVLSLMGVVSFLSLSQMDSITRQMTTLLEETNTKISAANTMRDSIRVRGGILYKMSFTDDYIDRDEYRLEMSEPALKYQAALNTLHSFHISAREAKLLAQLMEKTRIAKALNEGAAENLLSDMPIDDINNSLQLANTSRQDMLAVLDELVTLQEKITRSTIYDTKKYQGIISDIILLLSLTIFFIALYITQLVVRETSNKNSAMRFQATHDELTQLLTRKEFNSRLNILLKAAKNNAENHALCFLDLDKFKIINDSCGHKAGDELLIQLTKLIKNSIRSNDTLARLGGDEFGLLLYDCPLDTAIKISEGMINMIKNHEFHWQGKTFHVGLSIGLVMITRETPSAVNAMTQADLACYAAKDRGRNQVQVHGLTENHSKKTPNKSGLLASIKHSSGRIRFSL